MFYLVATEQPVTSGDMVIILLLFISKVYLDKTDKVKEERYLISRLYLNKYSEPSIWNAKYFTPKYIIIHENHSHFWFLFLLTF